MMKISGGIYLIADAGLDKSILLNKLIEALKNGISIVQLYNTKNKSIELTDTINTICNMCHQFHVPVLFNNDWNLLTGTLLDGVHFDKIPEDFEQIKKDINKDFFKGITCSNNLSVVEWATNHQFDYISFCSMFPSPSAGQCEIVSFDTVKKARTITDIPFFLAGGINLNNINLLSELSFNGIAVISGIMSSADIPSSTKNYINELNKITKHAN